MPSACLEENSLIIYGNIYYNPVEMTFFQLCASIDNQGLKAGSLPITSGKRIPESVPRGHLNYILH